MCELDLACSHTPSTHLVIIGNFDSSIEPEGCGLALHPRAIPAGRCTRIRFAQLAVDVHCTDLKASFDLYVVRSSIKYLHARLLDAAAKR